MLSELKVIIDTTRCSDYTGRGLQAQHHSKPACVQTELFLLLFTHSDVV